jgi:outer membrane receptor protein involved in Fe transport
MRVKSNKAVSASARPLGAATTIAAAVGGILWGTSGVAWAQAQPAEQANAGGQQLQEVVVTGTTQAVKKLDASYSIVTATTEDIHMADPSSAAEIYKMSPGVWPEASGGQTGVNIDIAGFPNGGGDSPYFTTMIQGSPIYGSPALSFMDNSSMIRFDDTIERVEIVQGGPSALYGQGQPGATANFILRTGAEKQAGSFGVTFGSEGMYRIDAFESGKIADGWYGSIGGFYRDSNGVRDPQYPSDIGGQLTATLKHDLDNGYIMFWARTLHDKNAWYADFPYTVENGDVHTYPGFNQLNSTYNSKQLQNFQVPDPACNCFQNDDISNGRGAQLSYFGSELKESFSNGWSISNNFIFDGGYLNTQALVNNGNPLSLSDFIGTLSLPAPLTPADVVATYNTGLPVDPNQSVITQQVWYVQKKLTSVIDEFRVIKEIFANNTLTFGIYAAHYTMNDNWELGSNVLMTNVPNANPIILSATAGGNIYQVSSSQGIYNTNGGYSILQNGQGTNIAPYLTDSWKLGNFLIDASARVEHEHLNQETSNLANVQMGGPFDLWDNAVALPDGTYSKSTIQHTMPTYSGGILYEFSNNMSAYVRANNGTHFQNFDDIRCQVINGSNSCPSQVPLQTMQNYEIGFKVANRWTYIDMSFYDKEFSGLAYTPVNIQNQPIGPASTYGSTAKGGRILGSVNPFASSDNNALASFKITVNAIYEKAHYKDFQGCFLYQDINGNTVCGSINNNQLARLPKFQIRITPSDTQTFSWGTLTEAITYENIGLRYQDQSNLTPLPQYYDLAAAIDARIGESWEFRLLGSNLTNQLGLTEGNARFGGNTVQNNVGFGRSILGREVNLTLKYFW